MKKTYQKPRILIEQFTLVEHIAVNCYPGEQIIANYNDGGSCYYKDANLSIFSDGVSGCTFELDEEIFPIETIQGIVEGSGDKCYNAFLNGAPFAS